MSVAPPPTDQESVNEALEALSCWRCFEDPQLSGIALAALLRVPEPERAVTWGELARVGDKIEQWERLGWDPEAAPDTTLDAQTAELWTAWANGSQWRVQKAWEKLFLPEANKSFHAVCASRHLPDAVVQRALKDLKESFFVALLGGDGQVAGWQDIALRVIERAASGPVQGLANLLPAHAWSGLAGCVAVRGTWAATLKLVWPGHSTANGRAHAEAEVCRLQPGRLDALLDLHVLLRLLEHDLSRPGLAWGIVRQNRCKLRGRLRALVSRELGPGLLPALLAQPRLYQLTAWAVRNYSLSWAWSELSLDFPFGVDPGVTSPCSDPDLDVDPEPITPALRTWVLLVAMRGRLEHLRRWVYRGGTGDKDATWGRLLANDLPAQFTPRADPRRARLRQTLSFCNGEVLGGWLPLLEQLAALPPGRDLKARMSALLAPVWDERVPFPQRQFTEMQEHLRRLLAERPPLEEDPWIP